jgi:hypothetical protein
VSILSSFNTPQYLGLFKRVLQLFPILQRFSRL